MTPPSRAPRASRLREIETRGLRLACLAERPIDALARRRLLACLFVGVLAIGLRLALVPLRGVPKPSEHDEFSYILQAETFSAGRLANPTHPLWPFFETINVNQAPTYASKYPPGQGLFLALGIRLFGDPWYGVLLSVGVMCACICWMLQGWLPPRYGVFGGIVAALQFAGASTWVNSYWGGAVAAAGGALVLGALPRVQHRSGAAVAVIAAIGIVVLLNTRPFEGSVLISGCIGALLWQSRDDLRRVLRPRTIAAAALVLSIGAMGMAYYDYRVTGDATELPWLVHQRRYALSPMFWVQPLRATTIPVYRDQAMKGLWEWDLDLYRQARENPLHVLYWLSKAMQQLIDGPMLVMAGFAAAGFLIAGAHPRLGVTTAGPHPRFRMGAGIAVWFLLAVLSEKFILSHYLAPAVGLLFLFTAAGLRLLHAWRWGRVHVGSAFVMLATVMSVVVFVIENGHRIDPLAAHPLAARFAAESQLQQLPGKHVIFVRYSPHHNVHAEFVYNGPDIDGQKIVWAIDRGVQADSELQRYYSGRTFWLLAPDEPHPRVTPYPER